MIQETIITPLGPVAIHRSRSLEGATPVIFLHGVYLDHHLWDEQVVALQDHPVILVDMPWHGASREGIKANWSLDDCAVMLIAILDTLQVRRVIAVGHSWGSMTILRSASAHPDRFAAVGLCNMPFLAATLRQRIAFLMQHPFLAFRDFYTRRAAGSLFGAESLRSDPRLLQRLRKSMGQLSDSEIRRTDRAVILDARDARPLIASLSVQAIALKGLEDYVPAPPGIETRLVPGGHISPWERPNEVAELVDDLIRLVRSEAEDKAS